MRGKSAQKTELTPRTFTESCVSEKYGGVQKTQDAFPDPLHTYLSLAGLANIGAFAAAVAVDSRIGFPTPSYLN